MARPAKDPRERLEVQTVRFDAKTLDRLRAKAEREGKTLSEVIREAVKRRLGRA